MEEGKNKKRACVDKVWNDNAFKIVNELILDGYQNGDTWMVYKFFTERGIELGYWKIL